METRPRSMAETSVPSSSNAVLLGGRAIDRHNPIIRDSRRATPRTLSTPSSSHQKRTKNRSASERNDDNVTAASEEDDRKKKGLAVLESTPRRTRDGVLKRNWIEPPDSLAAPPSSARYWLRDAGFLDGAADAAAGQEFAPSDQKKVQSADEDEPPTSSANPSSPPDQVVVLKVSLHCKGCAGKLRKHLSKMEGVTSFNIDFAAKKVTVVGNVTLVGVLSTVSKVKTSQILPDSSSSPLVSVAKN